MRMIPMSTVGTGVGPKELPYRKFRVWYDRLEGGRATEDVTAHYLEFNRGCLIFYEMDRASVSNARAGFSAGTNWHYQEITDKATQDVIEAQRIEALEYKRRMQMASEMEPGRA